MIAGFVLLILGIVFVSQIATLGQDITTTTGVSNETHNVLPTIETGRNDTGVNSTIVYTLTNAPTSWKVNDCPITNFVLTNSSGGAFTITTDYILTASAGTYTLVDSATMVANLPAADNNTLASYNYCGDDYMNLGWGRTGIDLVPGFFALALLLISVGLFYSVAKETGVMN